MEVMDEGGHGDPDCDGLDFIEAVARANDASADGADLSEVLPELRSSPCPLHHRNQQQLQQPRPLHKQRSDNRNDFLYSTNFHGGHGKPRSARMSPCGHRDESRIQTERDFTFHKDVQAGKSQTYARPTLPKEMTSEDFVTTWLSYGSEPQGKSHFPEIVPPKRRSSKSNTVNQVNAIPQNSGRKLVLSPIQTCNTPRKWKAKASNASE